MEAGEASARLGVRSPPRAELCADSASSPRRPVFFFSTVASAKAVAKTGGMRRSIADF